MFSKCDSLSVEVSRAVANELMDTVRRKQKFKFILPTSESSP